MTIPLQVTFHQMDPSDTVRERIRERAEKLEQYCQRVGNCRVVVEAPHRHHHKGKLYTVAVEVQVPGAMLTSHRNPGQRHAHEDIYVALRDSFDSIERQIEDFVRRRRGE